MKLGIIIGSVRQGRVSDKVAQWIYNAAAKQPGVNAEIIDLLEYKLPFFDEAISPQYNAERTTEGDVTRWLNVLSEQDAFIIVTPEYNRSIAGVLKNALDFIAYEMSNKPVAIATHGATGGAQAVAHLRGIIPGVLAVTTPTFIGLPYAAMASFDKAGTFDADEHGHYAALLEKVLGELSQYSKALATTRG